MDQAITYQFSQSLQPLSQSEWSMLFADHPDSSYMIELVELSGLDGFKFHSIVARVGDVPVLLLPIFETSYCLTAALSGSALKVGRWLQKVTPKLICPRILGVGFVEGEWGQIGINRSMPAAVLERALTGAMEILDTVAESLDAQVIAFKDFCPDNYRILPQKTLRRFSAAVSLPFCQIRTSYFSLDEYLNKLPRKVRQDLRQKMRSGSAVRVEHTTDISSWLDQVYALYTSQVQRSHLSFGRHNRRYFEEVCQKVKGAFYILFFAGDQLIGFNLVVKHQDRLIDKYIGMDPLLGRFYNVYYLSWLEKIRFCTTNGVSLLHLGASAESVKVRMGAYTIPSYLLFRHRNPFIHFALSKLTGLLSYKPNTSRDQDDQTGEEVYTEPIPSLTKLEQALC